MTFKGHKLWWVPPIIQGMSAIFLKGFFDCLMCNPTISGAHLLSTDCPLLHQLKIGGCLGHTNQGIEL